MLNPNIRGETILMLPMLAMWPADKYPRYRDCFLGEVHRDFRNMDGFGMPMLEADKQLCITVYMRIGGWNRDDYTKEISYMRASPFYLKDYDDEFDSTYAMFVFAIPSQFLPDYNYLTAWQFERTSPMYHNLVTQCYPDLFDNILE